MHRKLIIIIIWEVVTQHIISVLQSKDLLFWAVKIYSWSWWTCDSRPGHQEGTRAKWEGPAGGGHELEGWSEQWAWRCGDSAVDEGSCQTERQIHKNIKEREEKLHRRRRENTLNPSAACQLVISNQPTSTIVGGLRFSIHQAAPLTITQHTHSFTHTHQMHMW